MDVNDDGVGVDCCVNCMKHWAIKIFNCGLSNIWLWKVEFEGFEKGTKLELLCGSWTGKFV